MRLAPTVFTLLLGLAGSIQAGTAAPSAASRLAPGTSAVTDLAVTVLGGTTTSKAAAVTSIQDRKKKKKNKKKQPPHTHQYQRTTVKVWIKPETKEVVVGTDKKGRPIKKTVVVKPGRYETRVQQRCRCGVKK